MALTNAEYHKRYREKHPDRFHNSLKKYFHSDKGKIYRKNWEEENKEKRRFQARERYRRNPEKYRKKHNDYYIKNLEKARTYSRVYFHSEKGQQLAKQRIFTLKNTVFNHYSPGGIKCALSEVNHPGYDCTDFEVLSIDHVNGNGANHRREIKRSGNRFYLWLIQQGFPEGYRVLCYNCQQKEKLRLKLLTGNRTNHPTKY